MGVCENKKKKEIDIIEMQNEEINLRTEQPKIVDEIQNLKKIVLNQKDFIGKGQYGEVYYYKILNTPLAVKCFQNEAEAIQEKDAIESIQAIAINCPGIIQYYGMKKLEIEIAGLLAQKYSGYAIFLQQCSLDLERLKILPKHQILNFLSQISLSLFCLHSNGFFHGDIKPANILADKNNSEDINYYLTDYGQGKCIEELINTNYQTLSLRGTPYYFSPELWDILNNRQNFAKYNPLSTDIYALGIICLEFLLGQKFVQNLNMARVQEQQFKAQLQIIKNELLKTVDEFQQNENNELLIMLLKMVSFHSCERPQAIEICQALIFSKLFSIDSLGINSMKALIIQLISSFQPRIKTNGINDQAQVIQMQKIQAIQKELKAIELPNFQSDIIKDLAYSTIILSLFENSKICLSRLHHQSITKHFSFNAQKFHQDCDKKGSTLTIFKSSEEPQSLFGGMAVPEWQSTEKPHFASDPADQYSWLFKIELEGKQVNIHQWKCINKTYAIWCQNISGIAFGGYYLGGGLYANFFSFFLFE